MVQSSICDVELSYRFYVASYRLNAAATIHVYYEEYGQNLVLGGQHYTMNETKLVFAIVQL
jgi:hypothetical protein